MTPAHFPQNCPHCGQKWAGRASVPTPALYPAHFSVRRKPSGIRPKPLQTAGAAIVTLPRSCLPTQRLTAAHSGSQGRTRGFHLRCQLLLHTVTLDSSLDQIKRCRLCCSTACSGFSLSTAMQLLSGVNCHGNLQPEQNVSCFEIYICTPWFARMHLKWSILSTVCRKRPLKISHC